MLAISRISKSALLLLLISTPAIAQEAVRWSEDLGQATKIAEQSNKLVLVHFWAPWCKPCLRMDAEVFNQPGVGSAIEANFVPVKLNADQFAATAPSFGVTSLPADVILSPQGQVVAKYNSPKTAAEYLAQANQIAMANVAQQAGNTPLAGAAAGAATAGQFAANTTNNIVSPPAANDRYAVPAQHSQPMPTHQDRYAPPTDRYAAPPATPQTTPPMGRYGAPAYNPSTPTASPNTPAGPTGYAGPPAGANPGAANQGAAIGSRYGSPAPTAAPAEQVTSNPYANVQIPPMNNTAPPAAANPYMQQAQTGAPPAAQQPPAQPWNPQSAAPPVQANPYLGQAYAPPQQASPPTAANPAFGMEGFCPVTMIEMKTWTPGDRRFGAIHEGKTYLFSSAENQQKFLADPNRYAPAMAGSDPVVAIDAGQTVPGQRRHGVSYNNRVYLFSSEASLAQFSQNPDRYVNGIRQAMQQSATQYPRR